MVIAISLCFAAFHNHIRYFVTLGIPVSLIDQCTLISLLGLPINRRQGEVDGINQPRTKEWSKFSDAVRADWRLYSTRQNANSLQLLVGNYNMGNVCE